MSAPGRWDAEERESRAGLIRLMAMVESRLAQGASACEVLQALEGETAALLAVVHAARRADAEAWFARQTKPKRTRITSGTYRRAAAGDAEAIRQLRDREREVAAQEARAARRRRPVSG